MSQTVEQRKPPFHLKYLDSVRGIAATIVVIYHFVAWGREARTETHIISLLFNGADAVAFFFVLSGFVLSYKTVVLKQNLDIGKFYVNRWFRLWPAYFFTVLINTLYHQRNGLDWTKAANIFIYNKVKFWEEALLIRGVSAVYYAPGWTLFVELVMSFFIPYMIVIVTKDRKLMWWFTLFLFFLGASITAAFGMFVLHFAYGVLICAYYLLITSDDFKRSWVYRKRFFLLPLAIFLYSMRHLELLFNFGWFYDEVIFKFLGYDVFFFTGIGSALLLVFIMASRKAQKILESPLLRFIGKISYGIYLMHWLIVTFIYVNWGWLITYFPPGKWAFLGLLAICMILTIVFATIVYYAIERPFIRLGKRLTARMRSTYVIKVEDKVQGEV